MSVVMPPAATRVVCRTISRPPVCMCLPRSCSHLAVFVMHREGHARLDFIQVRQPVARMLSPDRQLLTMRLLACLRTPSATEHGV